MKGKLQAAGYTVTEQPCTSGCTSGAGPNLIAEWPQGDASAVYMFGAHLDGVSAGPGMNDNGSGSAALLENALTLARENPDLRNRVRFAWWTDEEQGLNGSDFYVRTLSSTERSRIKAYYNFDMVASLNGGYFVNHITSAAAAPMKAYWDSLGLQPEENTEGAGRSDDYSFERYGIPTSGYAMGASARKTSAQAAKWGGTSGAAYDPATTGRATRCPTSTPPGWTARPTASRTPCGSRPSAPAAGAPATRPGSSATAGSRAGPRRGPGPPRSSPPTPGGPRTAAPASRGSAATAPRAPSRSARR